MVPQFVTLAILVAPVLVLVQANTQATIAGPRLDRIPSNLRLIKKKTTSMPSTSARQSATTAMRLDILLAIARSPHRNVVNLIARKESDRVRRDFIIQRYLMKTSQIIRSILNQSQSQITVTLETCNCWKLCMRSKIKVESFVEKTNSPCLSLKEASMVSLPRLLSTLEQPHNLFQRASHEVLIYPFTTSNGIRSVQDRSRNSPRPGLSVPGSISVRSLSDPARFGS